MSAFAPRSYDRGVRCAPRSGARASFGRGRRGEDLAEDLADGRHAELGG